MSLTKKKLKKKMNTSFTKCLVSCVNLYILTLVQKSCEHIFDIFCGIDSRYVALIKYNDYSVSIQK